TGSIGFRDNVMQLTVGEETFAMQPVKTASGAKYEAVGDPTTTFWSKGNRATLVVRGQTYPECTKEGTEAKVFRATGNEPGWKLEIGGNRMSFLADTGQIRIEVPTPAAETTAEFRKYRAKTGGHDLTITIFDRICTDTMSGMPYPNQVAVVFDGKELNGCGGDPATLLQGAEWVVEDISGSGIIDRSRATLNFGADGRIFGKASCNNYTGGYSLTGEGLTISSNAAMTMMACAPALMQQEHLFTEILKNVQRFTLSPDGALVLHTGDKRTITARRG
ncbi:MAG TPA: META domain-containing protein, partial [Candidatus Competibacteraceae bacterium]|nr:META domain-containing protein [Candidatus Competibacteraceae bacterium]